MSNVSNLTVADQLTEDGAALLFRAAYNGKLLFCHDRKSWMRCEDGIWKPDRTDLAMHYARELARGLTTTENPTTKQRLGKTAFAAGVERFSRADPAFARTADHWDRNALIMGVPGGFMVDLRNGKILKADPAEMLTRSAAVTPLTKPDCPLWLSFLREATNDDTEAVDFLQQWCGYCLTGSVREHALLFVFGPGGNGKSVFINTVAAIMGDYAMTSNMDVFTKSKHERHPTELADFQGKRLVIASEVAQGKVWAEDRIKQLTGGDRIRARFMRENFFEFDPQHKIVVVGNHQPSLAVVDDAMRRRFNVLPFIHKPARPDAHLEERLRAEYDGILAWMIEGCLSWQARGLTRSASILAATAEYFSEQDVFGQWLAERTIPKPGGFAVGAHLFANWKRYADAAGEPVGTQRTFASEMKPRGYTKGKLYGNRGFNGLELRPDDRADALDTLDTNSG